MAVAKVYSRLLLLSYSRLQLAPRLVQRALQYWVRAAPRHEYAPLNFVGLPGTRTVKCFEIGVGLSAAVGLASHSILGDWRTQLLSAPLNLCLYNHAHPVRRKTSEILQQRPTISAG